ncbi:MAG: hypothetical protein ACW9W4_09160 [Candidatus Nitrosopumilus sp. bin_7KS]
MSKCKECGKEYGKEYETGIKEFCSDDCYKIDIQKRINEATANEISHTIKFSKSD